MHKVHLPYAKMLVLVTSHYWPLCKSVTPFENRQMALCNGCNEWYHRECKRIPKEVFERSDVDWLCDSCKD